MHHINISYFNLQNVIEFGHFKPQLNITRWIGNIVFMSNFRSPFPKTDDKLCYFLAHVYQGTEYSVSQIIVA